MEDLENENDDQENSRDSKSDSDDFDKDFDDIKIDVSWELKHIWKIHVSEASFHQKEPSFTLTIVFKSNKEADEKSKSVCRKYSEFQWLDSQLQKSFPGWLIPSLPSIYDVTNPFSTKIIREVDSSETIKDLSYTYNDHITLSNYVAQILGNERFRNWIKLKEFITNEEIKMFANMDNDDPLLHNRIFKFFKSTGKSLLNYAWSTENQDLQNSNDLKGNSISIHDEKSPQEISKLLKVAKLGIDSQVLILTELCTNIFNLIKSVWVLNTRDYKQLDEDQWAISKK